MEMDLFVTKVNHVLILMEELLPGGWFRYIFAMLLAIPLGFGHRLFKSQPARHWAAALPGLLLAYWVFGAEIWQSLFLMLFTLSSLRLFNPLRAQIIVWFVSLVLVLAVHIHGTFHNYLAWRLDHSGPIMVMVIKMTTLVDDVRDGSLLNKGSVKLSTNRQKNAIKEIPSVLSVLSYSFWFGGYFAGPAISFREWENFISLEMFPKRIIPSSWRKTLVAFVQTILFYGLFWVHEQGFSVDKLREESFFEFSLLSRLVFIFLSLYTLRFRYYFGWRYASVANVAAGLAYKSEDDWSRAQQVHVMRLQTTHSPSQATTDWNIRTSAWLKFHVYRRLTPMIGSTMAMLCTHFVSACWHGVYPGYFVSYFSLSMLISSWNLAEKAYAKVKGIKGRLDPDALPMGVKVLRWWLILLAWTYIWIPFMLLDFESGYRVMKSVGFYVHILFLLVIIASSAILREPKRKSKENGKIKKE